MIRITPAIPFLIITLSTVAQIERDHPDKLNTGYSNAKLAFRYAPPLDMRDKTEQFRREIREYAEAIHSRKTLIALLSMSSGSDDKAPTWRSITIETYPRSAVQNLDDVHAEVKMSGWVAHSHASAAPPKIIRISGQTFAVSLFGFQEGNVRKGAVVWTTIRRGQLLSFAFVANSPRELAKLAETMKTVEFF
jgi:hypothetical protein